MSNKIIGAVASTVLGTTLLTASFSATADDHQLAISGNAGIMSDYIFRGIVQDDAVGNGGIDLEFGGAYAGVWAADVGDGIEYDIYGGYIHEFESAYVGAGYTAYRYTEASFDSDYDEINLYAGASMGAVSVDLEYTMGEYDGDYSNGDDEYTFMALTGNYGGAYVTYGDWGKDAGDDMGSFFEVGYTMELGGLELTGAIVDTTDADALDEQDETQAYVSIHWGFDIL